MQSPPEGSDFTITLELGPCDWQPTSAAAVNTASAIGRYQRSGARCTLDGRNRTTMPHRLPTATTDQANRAVSLDRAVTQAAGLAVSQAGVELTRDRNRTAPNDESNHGTSHRSHEPEGRSRQDDDRHQSRRLARRRAGPQLCSSIAIRNPTRPADSASRAIPIAPTYIR